MIEYNLFEHCDGESEIISVKSNGNILRHNTFRHSRGALVLRHGDENRVTNNFFIADPKHSRSAGVRLQGTDQFVAGNYFKDCGFGVAMMDGLGDNFYVRVERAQVLFNTFIDCRTAMKIGIVHSRYTNGQTPIDCTIRGNAFHRTDPTASGSFIEYVKNDQPEKWTWQDNQGLEPTDRQPATRRLTLARSGLFVPTEHSLIVALPKQRPAELSRDLLGTTIKGARRTAGAIQRVDPFPQVGPLTADDVGPDRQP